MPNFSQILGAPLSAAPSLVYGTLRYGSANRVSRLGGVSPPTTRVIQAAQACCFLYRSQSDSQVSLVTVQDPTSG